MRRAILAFEDDPEPSIVESQLLGTLMVCPYLRLDCQNLRPSDFSSAHRGAAFEAIMATRHPEIGLVVAHLERAKVSAPPGCTGWGDALARCLDATFVDDDAVPDAVRVIRESAIQRRIDRRQRAF